MRDLGSRALRRWGSSPHARTKNKTICLWRMVLFKRFRSLWPAQPQRDPDMPEQVNCPCARILLRKILVTAPAPPRRVGSMVRSASILLHHGRRNRTHARFTALRQHITVFVTDAQNPFTLQKKLGYTGKWKEETEWKTIPANSTPRRKGREIHILTSVYTACWRKGYNPYQPARGLHPFGGPHHHQPPAGAR